MRCWGYLDLLTSLYGIGQSARGQERVTDGKTCLRWRGARGFVVQIDCLL